jgi:hypothetical protein
MIEWVAGAAGGKVVKFDAKTNTASSDFNDFKGDVSTSSRRTTPARLPRTPA